jgi:hypothetical protein
VLEPTVNKLFPRPLVSLLTAFFALALFYSLVIPIFEGPDEDDHFRFAKFISDHRALPVQLFEPGGGEAGHQGWQPPLYYTLVALIIAPIDTSDYSEHLYRNYAATPIGDPSCCGRNLYFHFANEDFPYTRTTLAVHLARLLSILFGAITVAATYALTKTVISNSELPITNYQLLPLLAASIVAFNPSFLFASALVSNDAPLAACSTLVLLTWVKLLRGQLALDVKSAATLGALISLGVLTKTSALGLVPFTLLLFAIIAFRQRDLRLFVSASLVLLAIITFVDGWWFARNQVLYGDPLAYRLMTTSAIFPRAGPLTLPELFQISLPWLWQTFWGGPTPGDFSPIILVVLAALTVLAALGMSVFVSRITYRALRITFAFLVVWLGFILVAQVQFIRTTVGADQGRYLFPAIAAFALFFVVGLNQVSGNVAGRIAPHASRLTQHVSIIGSLAHCLIASFFLLALFVPFAYTLPAYARPALLSESALARAPHPRQVNFANQIELRGYDLDARSVKQGDTLQVTLYWRALAPMGESYRVFVHLIGPNDRSAGGADVIPARGAFPTVYWKPGDALRDVVQIPVAANALPGKYAVEVGLYPVGKPGERLEVVGAGDDRVIVGAVKVAPRESMAYAPQTRVGANFADRARLIGYDAKVDSNSLALTLYWQSTARFDRDYTVFVHVLNADGEIIAQVDQQPQAGNSPTSLWDVGEQIRDDYLLTLSSPAANYRIEVGLYRADTGERLSVRVGANQSDHVEMNVPGAAQ